MPGDLHLRDLTRPLLAVVVANLALMLVWSVVVPIFRGADEHVHHDFVRHLTTTWNYPDYDELPVHQRTLATERATAVSHKDAPAARADEATNRSERPSWNELGPNVRDYRNNQMAQHPPLYYVPTAAVVRLIDADGDAPVDRVVWQLRLLNILTLTPLPLLASDIARRFTSSRAVVLAAAAGIVMVPQLTHLGATVSNDPLMILLGSVTLAGVARLLTGDRRWATAAVTGVAAGLALFTKGFAVPLVPAVALACLLPLFRRWDGGDHGEDDVPTPGTAGIVGRSGLVALLALVFGGWWWIRNVVVHGNPQPGIGLRDRVPVDVDVVYFAGNFSERLVDSFWGNVGWREAQLPVVLSALLTVGLIALVGVACWRHWRRLVLLVPAVVAGGMTLAAGWGAYKKTGVSYATQGRYLFTGIVAIVALAVLGVDRLLRGRVGRLPVAVFGSAVVLQLAMLVIAGRRYWAGDGLVDRLRALVAFSPLPDLAAVGVLVAAPVAAVTAVAVLWQTSGRPDWTSSAGVVAEQD